MSKVRYRAVLCCFALASASLASVAAEAPPMTPDTVNRAVPDGNWAPGDASAAILRTQVLLERAHFSPGEIDGKAGSNLRQAIVGFQASHGLERSGKLDAATWQVLQRDAAPALTTVTLGAADVAGPFRPLPSGMAAQARLDALG